MVLAHVDSYRVSIDSGTTATHKAKLELRCSNPSGTAHLFFLPDGVLLPENDAREESGGIAWHVYFHIPLLARIIQDLRNEKPVYFFFNRSSKTAGIRTGSEPVGEVVEVPETFEVFQDFARGSRPLLAVLVEFNDFKFSLDNEVDHYENLVFGPGYPNLLAFFKNLSDYKFGWERASLIGPLQYPGTAADAQSAGSTFDSWVLEASARAGFDFSLYDKDHDGVTNDKELGLLIINANYPGVRGGGQTRGIPNTEASGVQVKCSGSFCDEFGGLNLFAHELTHQLGIGQDLYGPGAALNFRASFMAGTPSAPDHRPIQLDPWHKMRAGWLRPRVFRMTGHGSTYLRQSILLYDPDRRNEFFLVEYRAPRTGPTPPEGGYDEGVLGQGIAIWYVHTDSERNRLVSFRWPPSIAPEGEPTGHMHACYLIGPNGPGKGPFWTEANGEFPLNWPDGTETRLRLRVGSLSPTDEIVAVQWRVV